MSIFDQIDQLLRPVDGPDLFQQPMCGCTVRVHSDPWRPLYEIDFCEDHSPTSPAHHDGVPQECCLDWLDQIDDYRGELARATPRTPRPLNRADLLLLVVMLLAVGQAAWYAGWLPGVR